MITPDSAGFALIVLRVAVGAVFVAHGINHIVGGGKIGGTARWFESLGMKPGKFHAWTASLTEIAAGVSLILGLLVSIGCAGVVGVMVVAWITNHLKNGFFIFRPGEGWEYVMVLTMCGISLGMLGGGRFSLDSALGIHSLSGWIGLLIVGVGGIGGALLLLATFWRPDKVS